MNRRHEQGAEASKEILNAEEERQTLRELNMRTKIMVVALTLLVAATGVSLAAENPLIGTWKLNERKSKYAPGSDKDTTITYAAAKGDMIKCTAEGVDKDGNPIHWTWTGKLDGKPYPIKGSAAFDTLAYRPVNDRTNDTTAIKNGKVVMTAVITVAKDGKSRTVTLTSTNAKGRKITNQTYYDKEAKQGG
jgi:hypothetical protein